MGPISRKRGWRLLTGVGRAPSSHTARVPALGLLDPSGSGPSGQQRQRTFSGPPGRVRLPCRWSGRLGAFVGCLGDPALVRTPWLLPGVFPGQRPGQLPVPGLDLPRPLLTIPCRTQRRGLRVCRGGSLLRP